MIANERTETAEPTPARPLAPRRELAGYLARLIAKQQTTALLATAVDYVVMIAGVSGAGLHPSVATALGALAGMVVGFALARRWVFRASDGSRVAQAWRYVAVSFVSLVANAVGEWLAVRAGLQYLVARTIVSIAIGLGWNLPMQQFFVFNKGRRAR